MSNENKYGFGICPDEPSKLVRLPFRIKVYDEKLKEIQTPVFWLEFPEPPHEGGWDWLQAVEVEAKKILAADLEVGVVWESIVLK